MTPEITDAEPATAQNIFAAVDFASILADFRRFFKFFAAIFVVVFLVVLVPILLQAPNFDATSSVMIDPRTINASPDADVLSDLPADTTTIDTEVEVLGSNALTQRVVDSLHLDKDPEFNPALAPRKVLGIIPMPAGRGGAPAESQAQLVQDAVRAGLTVKRSGLTRIITITYRSKSAAKAARIANEWARLYLSQQLETKFNATKEANDWLNSRIGDLRTQVEAAETELQNYKIANNLVSSSNDDTIAQQEVTTLDQQLATVKVDQAESDARLNVAKRQLANGSTGEDLGEALNSSVIRDLRNQRATLTQHMADLSSKYGPLHPDIIKTKKQLDDIDGQIKAEVNRIISNLEGQAQIQRQRTASLQGSVNRARGQLVGNNRATVRLNELQRNADAVTVLYQSYLDRFKQTSSQAGIDQTDARIVSTAGVPLAAATPKKPLALALALVAGLAAATLAVLVRRALDSGMATGADVEAQLDQPYLGGIIDLPTLLPKGIKSTPRQYLLDKPLSAFAEGFRNIRAGLVYSKLGEAVKVIAITSSLPDEGKTTTSICLARTMAMAGQSVLLIDCDLRRRSLAKALDMDVSKGLLEVLTGTVAFEDAIIKDPTPGVDYLALTHRASPAKDIFGSPMMAMLLDEARAKYDVIILDTAPVIPVVDTRILLRQADVTVMLARWRKTPRRAVQTSIGLLADVGVKVGGVVLTKVDLKAQSKFGYGDSMYYYNQYKEYYAS